jgi:hypothetical protein
VFVIPNLNAPTTALKNEEDNDEEVHQDSTNIE